jgi:hypothetical protein
VEHIAEREINGGALRIQPERRILRRRRDADSHEKRNHRRE